MQDLKDFTRVRVTLKSGKQIEICVEKAPESFAEAVQMIGFISTPLVVAKTTLIRDGEIAAVEIIKEPNIVFNMPEA